jgi:hypothetical protein
MEPDASFSSTDNGADPGATPQKPASQGAYHMSSASSPAASALADSLRRHISGVDSESIQGGGEGGDASATATTPAFDASVFKRRKGSALGDRDRLSLNSEFAQKLEDIEGQYEVRD